jgi:hypothetical protein
MGIKAVVDPVDLYEAVRRGATGRVRTFDRLRSRFPTWQHEPADFALRLFSSKPASGATVTRIVKGKHSCDTILVDLKGNSGAEWSHLFPGEEMPVRRQYER